MTAFDIEPNGGSAGPNGFFDLDRTNSAAVTGLDRDNLMASVKKVGSVRGLVTVTFPPRPDITLDSGDVGISISLMAGRFSSDAFLMHVNAFSWDGNLGVSGGTIGGGEDYVFSPRLAGANFTQIQDAAANGWTLTLEVAAEATVDCWGSWTHVYATYFGTAAAAAKHAPPLRQTRRNDGLRGSVRSLRATSRQRSLRRGPGTIL